MSALTDRVARAQRASAPAPKEPFKVGVVTDLRWVPVGDTATQAWTLFADFGSGTAPVQAGAVFMYGLQQLEGLAPGLARESIVGKRCVAAVLPGDALMVIEFSNPILISL